MAGDPNDIRSSSISSQQKPRTVSFTPLSIVKWLIVIALIVGSFFVGRATVKTTSTTAGSKYSANGSGYGGYGGGSGGPRDFGMGQVDSISSTAITITNSRSGTQTTYQITSSTTVTNQGQTASISDIQAGDTVIVRTSSSSPTTATSILINPSFGGYGGGQSGAE